MPWCLRGRADLDEPEPEAASGGRRPGPRCRSCGHTRPDLWANPVGTEPQPSPADYVGWLMCLMRFTVFYTRPMILVNWALMNDAQRNS